MAIRNVEKGSDGYVSVIWFFTIFSQPRNPHC
jgi:hypothetical protein